MTKPITLRIDDYELVCRYSPGRPAKTEGPPEDCYPEDEPEIEVISGKLHGCPMSEYWVTTMGNHFNGRLLEAAAEQLADRENRE